jgi:siderophore synthetase component
MEERTVKIPSISVKKIFALIPRSQDQLEVELKGILKLVFWVALLLPVVLIPIYYILVAYGLAPQIHLPGG